MRLLFVHAHPVPESFNSALCKAAVDTALARGHDVRLIDLHAEGFDPVMSTKERRLYNEEGPPPPDLRPHVEALQWAEGLIFVYPTWWYSQPAILKGWMDRVWRPGITFTLPTPTQAMRPALTNVRLIGVITTFGSPWWFWTLLIGAPGRKIMLRGLRFCTHPRTRTFWLGLHEMDTQTDAARRRYLDRVRARIARIPV
ncbi:NAD(P)H-dependent oxidoreductase [Tabrizicola caldifontis]|uniref:NAD(P)H-dependent oxidoreductase n=1 Tax=Tabrizicola caldifontis TaxID=2528036 RepID=UPI00108032B2|nr:NAD(P)H-dependent oxidoreductase [Rhodobacter sp. YIM 73028]